MNLANQITIARILLIPFFVIVIAYYSPEFPHYKWLATALFFLACLSDAVDGYLARVRKMQTSLGTFLDPFADKLLLISAFLALFFSQGFTHKIPVWILIIVVSREIILISGLLIFSLLFRQVTIHPSLLGKITTVTQMITIGAYLLELSWAYWVACLAASLTIASGLGYIYREVRRENHEVAPR